MGTERQPLPPWTRGPRAFCGKGGPTADPHHHGARSPCSCRTKLARCCHVRFCVCRAPAAALDSSSLSQSWWWRGLYDHKQAPGQPLPSYLKCPLPQASDPCRPHTQTHQVESQPRSLPHTPPRPALDQRCAGPSLRGGCAEAGPAVTGCSAPTLPTDLCSPFLQRGGTDAVSGAAGQSSL